MYQLCGDYAEQTYSIADRMRLTHASISIRSSGIQLPISEEDKFVIKFDDETKQSKNINGASTRIYLSSQKQSTGEVIRDLTGEAGNYLLFI